MLVTVPAGQLLISGGATTRPYARTNYHPTINDVAALMRARTKDDQGNELGEFTTATRPTAVEVAVLIDGAVADVRIRVGDSIPSRLWPAAKQAAALKTAAAIERAYWPEQANQQDSAYELYRADYDDLIGQLVEATIDPVAGKRGVYSIGLTTTGTASDPLFPYDYQELLP